MGGLERAPDFLMRADRTRALGLEIRIVSVPDPAFVDSPVETGAAGWAFGAFGAMSGTPTSPFTTLLLHPCIVGRYYYSPSSGRPPLRFAEDPSSTSSPRGPEKEILLPPAPPPEFFFFYTPALDPRQVVVLSRRSWGRNDFCAEASLRPLFPLRIIICLLHNYFPH